MAVQVTHKNCRGADVVRQFGADSTVDDVQRYLETIKAPADAIDVGSGERIGGVDDLEAYADDERLRWGWWLDTDAVRWALLTMGVEYAQHDGGRR